jgi:hypothetical protein
MNTLDVVVAGVDMEVDFDYSAAVTGVYSGPWEDSYPDEPEEIEILAVRCPMPADKDGKPEYVDLLGVLSVDALNDIVDLISDYHNSIRWDDQFEQHVA